MTIIVICSGISHTYSQQNRAFKFFKIISGSLCVYSPSVRKLYSDFSVHLLHDFEKGVTILPDPINFSATYSRIDESAVSKTGVYLLAHQDESKGLFLSVPLKGKRHQLSLQTGIRYLQSLYKQRGSLFYPTVTKGDLRELRKSRPILHLHQLNIDKLSDLSGLEQEDIASAISQRFRSIFDINYQFRSSNLETVESPVVA